MIPGSGRSPGGGHGYPLQCSCLDNPMDRGAWRATVHGVVKSRTRLKRLSTKTCTGKLNRFTKVPKVNHTSCKTQIHFTLTEKLNYLLNSYLTKDSLTTEEKKNSVFSKETFWCKSVHFNGPKVYFLEEIRLYTTTHKSTTVNSATELITQSQCSLKFWYMFPNLSSQSSPYQSTTWALRQSPSPTLANSGESAHSINLLKTSQSPPRLWSAFTGMPLELFPTFLATWVCSFACYLFRSSACFSRMGVFFCLSSQICWGVCLLVCGLIM